MVFEGCCGEKTDHHHHQHRHIVLKWALQKLHAALTDPGGWLAAVVA
jgi:hypothetical protein